jgi:hypothetical protein
MVCDLAWDYALEAEFSKKKGDQTQAKEERNRTTELMQECNADGWTKKFEEKLSGLCQTV